jgi:3-oxoacyl-[acyl-carrier-protein] synthase-1
MQNALKDAKLSPTDIDYVNAHAPSTSIGDASEMKALKATFPLPQKMKVSSTKPLTGHGLSLSSIMEAAFCCIALKDQFIPGSAHVKTPDPELGHLELIQESNEQSISRVMSNSSGFGGANVSVVFEKS